MRRSIERVIGEENVMSSLYLIPNGPAPTTAAQVPVTTGTAIKTMLQVRPFNLIRIVRWGVSFDGFAAALPIRCELLSTGTVFATVTALADADITKFNNPTAAAPSVAGLTLSTTGTGYTASAEGTITATDMYDVQFVSPTNQYVFPFELGREPTVAIGDALRIRVTAAAAVNCYAWVLVEIG
jgi:hypothetical protein